jgi:hypothetical protein
MAPRRRRIGAWSDAYLDYNALKAIVARLPAAAATLSPLPPAVPASRAVSLSRAFRYAAIAWSGAPSLTALRMTSAVAGRFVTPADTDAAFTVTAAVRMVGPDAPA